MLEWQGDDDLAISDILGDNTFLAMLFVIATVISEQVILPGPAHQTCT